MLLAEPNTPDSLSRKRCLAVNAAFLQEIKDDNRFLDELLLATRDALTHSNPWSVNVRALLELLRRLQNHLASHFSLEETFGYCDDAIDAPVEWSAEADAYRSQHASLYLDVCDMVEVVEGLLDHESISSFERSMQRLSSSFMVFYRRIKQHDAGEKELVDAVLVGRKGGTMC